MKKKTTIPSIHIPIQTPSGSMEWVWYLFLQYLDEKDVDLSNYYTKEETDELLDKKVDKTDQANKIYGTDEDGNQTTYNVGGLSVAIDDLTITRNDDDELQSVAVIDQNTGIAKTWTGTIAEYEAIVTKDPETEYIIIDDIGGSATEIGQITEALNNKVDKGHEVIEFQEPTSTNNYTWYRKYADGWVEQGGYLQFTAATYANYTLVVPMADTSYNLLINWYDSTAGATNVYGFNTANKTTTTFGAKMGTSGTNTYFHWRVEGMAA